MKLNIIYNKSIQGIIGLNNDLFVNIKGDLEWFKEHTLNNIVVMGYNTFCSLPGKEDINPLKKRLNIVITENHYDELIQKIHKKEKSPHIIVYKDFKHFYNHWVPNSKNNYKTFYESNQFKCDFLEEYKNVKDIFVIGGSKIYENVFASYPIDAIYETITDITVDVKDHIQKGHSVKFLHNKIKIEEYTRTYYKQFREKISLNNGFSKVDQEAIYSFSIYQANENINQQEMEYLRILKDIYENGQPNDSRNSRVLSIFSPPQMRFDLRKGFPLLTSKRVGWKTVLRELLWFISGSTNNKILQSKGVHIWDGNSTKEYMQKRGLNDYQEGDLGPIYGFQWRHFGAKYYGCNADHTGRGFDQLKYIIHEIKTNPTSRRIILNSWNAADLDLMALPPCHVMVQFNIDVPNKCIDAKLIQRSGDMFLGVPFNIASYSMLLHIIGNITGYTPRYFIHDIGNAHIYENHKNAIDIQLRRKTFDSPQFKITKDILDIDSLEESDFDMINYIYYPSIKADMVA